MTNEEAIKNLAIVKNLEDALGNFDGGVKNSDLSKSLAMAIKALGHQPCDDCISRQAAIGALDKIFPANPIRNNYTLGITCGAALATECIKQLPSAEPKIGKWILSGGYWRCSECKEKALLKLDKAKGNCKEYAPVRSIFCPNCGTKMEEVKE